MAERLIIPDLDRTLFDTSSFAADWLQVMIDRRLIEPEIARELQVRVDDPGRSVNILAELEDHSPTMGEVALKAVRLLEQNAYLYPDVVPFLNRHTADQLLIATTGADVGQRMKLDNSSRLAAYPHKILSGNKGEYLARELKEADGRLTVHDLVDNDFDELWLIDDRMDNLLPLAEWPTEKVRLIHIERPDAKYQRTADHARLVHITSLDELMELEAAA